MLITIQFSKVLQIYSSPSHVCAPTSGIQLRFRSVHVRVRVSHGFLSNFVRWIFWAALSLWSPSFLSSSLGLLPFSVWCSAAPLFWVLPTTGQSWNMHAGWQCYFKGHVHPCTNSDQQGNAPLVEWQSKHPWGLMGLVIWQYQGSVRNRDLAFEPTTSYTDTLRLLSFFPLKKRHPNPLSL